MSPTNEGSVGPTVAVTAARNVRASSSVRKDTAAPVSAMAAVHTTALVASSRVRRTRSTRAPRGTVASAPASPNVAASTPSWVSLMAKTRCRVGAIAASTERSA